jgi:hypothetical protein
VLCGDGKIVSAGRRMVRRRWSMVTILPAGGDAVRTFHP